MTGDVATTSNTPGNLPSVARVLRSLHATGWSGFEGLIATLLSGTTGRSFLIAKSGLQSGFDLRTAQKDEVLIAVESKRYADSTPLSERELLGEIFAAANAFPQLDCWILATTRPVSAQEEYALHQACSERGIDYLTIACGSPKNLGLLDVLCANQRSKVIDFMVATDADQKLLLDFESAIEEVLRHESFSDRMRELHSRLDSAAIGFPVFRQALNERLKGDLGDTILCKRRFRCALGERSVSPDLVVVKRTEVRDQLSSNWSLAQASSGPRALAVLGDEGDGKSWAVANWLNELVASPEAPAVFFFAAGEPTADVVDSMATHACEYAGLGDKVVARRRLNRWLGGISERRAVVVFDGLNERLDPKLWSDLAADIVRHFSNSVLLVMTCRTHTWKTKYEPVMFIDVTKIQVGPFSEAEFRQALQFLPLKARAPLIALGALVRRPRYFHCACEYTPQIPDGSDLSIELLYYLDWRHRQSRRPLLSLGTQDFERVLMSLAARALAGASVGRNRNVAIELGEPDYAHLEELASGGVLRTSGPLGKWSVQEPYLTLGLGMYLAALIEEAGGTIDQRVELAQATLGQTASWDLSGQVMQQALNHALRASSSFGIETPVALLHVWSQCLNGAEQASVFIPHLPHLCVVASFQFADFTWKEMESSHVLETSVLKALVYSLQTPEHHSVALEWLCRWLGGVHEFGESGLSDSDPRIERLANVNRLCDGGECVFPSSMVRLSKVGKRSELRLGRLALAAISCADRRVFWPAIVTALVSNQAMGGYRTELIAWIVRTSMQPLDDVAHASISAFIEDGDVITHNAARKLIQIIGSADLMPRLVEIPADPDPFVNPIQIEFDADPCTCFFIAPDREQLAHCLARPDVPYRLNLDRATVHAGELGFDFPEEFAAHVQYHARQVDAQKVRLHMSDDTEDVKWGDVEPVLCRVRPALNGDIARAFARTANSRSGLPLRQLSWAIDEYSTALGQTEIDSLLEAWERLPEKLGVDLQNDYLWAEGSLATAILPHLSAIDQIAFLLRRPVGSIHALAMEPAFKPLSLSEQAKVFASIGGDIHKVYIALWFLSEQAEVDQVLLAMLIECGLLSEISGARGLSIMMLGRLDAPDQLANRLLSEWTHNASMCDLEAYYGTEWIMVHRAPTQDVVVRCDNTYIGAILDTLKGDHRLSWSTFYGDLLLATMRRRIGESTPLSQLCIEVVSAGRQQPWPQISACNDINTSVSFISPHVAWGGLEPASADSIFTAFRPEPLQTRQAALLAALEAASVRGDWLFCCHIRRECIQRVVEAIPAFLDQFNEILERSNVESRTDRVQAILEAVTDWGLRSRHENAESWLDSLEVAAVNVNYRDGITGLLRRKLALFSSPVSESISSRWFGELIDAKSDHDFFRVAHAIGTYGDRQWVVDEAHCMLRSGSPRGRAMCIYMLAAVADGELAELNSVLAELRSGSKSWYDELAESALRYYENARDLQHWLRQALVQDDPNERLAAVRLVHHIADHRSREMLENLLVNAGAAVNSSSLVALRDVGVWGDKSPRAKQMNERLFATKVQHHVVAPWLPIDPRAQRQERVCGTNSSKSLPGPHGTK